MSLVSGWEMERQDLIALAGILADWAEPAIGATLYLYGSRARGDARAASDVDLVVDFAKVTDSAAQWWSEQNADEFASINRLLPGRLQILEFQDPLTLTVIAAPVRYQDRNVKCVLLPPKPERTG